MKVFLATKELSKFGQGAQVSQEDLAVGYGPAHKRVCPSPAFVPRLNIREDIQAQENVANLSQRDPGAEAAPEVDCNAVHPPSKQGRTAPARSRSGEDM